jgi:hypothetical protein
LIDLLGGWRTRVAMRQQQTEPMEQLLSNHHDHTVLGVTISAGAITSIPSLANRHPTSKTTISLSEFEADVTSSDHN